MPRKARIVLHLTTEELRQRYRESRDPVLRDRYQMMMLLSMGKLILKTAAVTGYTRRWVGEILKRYNAGGPDALVDGRHNNPGREPILDDLLCEQLTEALQGPAPDGGLWTGPKIARWVEERVGFAIHEQRGCEWARRLGFTLRRPRRRHTQADGQLEDDFKEEDFEAEIQGIVSQLPEDATVEVWAMDEHRLGLPPVLKQVWAPNGSGNSSTKPSPTKPSSRSRQWSTVSHSDVVS